MHRFQTFAVLWNFSWSVFILLASSEVLPTLACEVTMTSHNSFNHVIAWNIRSRYYVRNSYTTLGIPIPAYVTSLTEILRLQSLFQLLQRINWVNFAISWYIFTSVVKDGHDTSSIPDLCLVRTISVVKFAGVSASSHRKVHHFVSSSRRDHQ